MIIGSIAAAAVSPRADIAFIALPKDLTLTCFAVDTYVNDTQGGCILPLALALGFGNNIQGIGSGSLANNQMLLFVYLGIAAAGLGIIESYCFTRTSFRQIATIKKEYLKAILSMPVGWFDLKGNGPGR